MTLDNINKLKEIHMFKIGNKIPPQYTNTYVLHINVEHGDADFSEDFPLAGTEEQIRMYIECIKWHKNRDYDDRANGTFYDAPMFYPKGIEYSFPSDNVFYGNKAQPDYYEIRYYDKHGCAYKVSEE